MVFYDREKEIADLRKTEENSQQKAQMTIFMGRRRESIDATVANTTFYTYY